MILLSLLLGLLSLLLSLLRSSGGSLLGTLSLDGDAGLVLALLLNELDEVLDGAGTLVGDGVLLVTGGEELDGREALDLIRDIVGSSVNLGNDNLVLELRVGVLGAEVVVLGGQSLAVTAPGGVELDEDILLVVEDNVIVVLGDNNGNGAVLGLGDGLRLDARLNLAGNKVLEELGDVVSGQLLLLVKGELLVLLDLLDGERGELVGLEVQVGGVSTEGLGVNDTNVDLALVLLSDGLERVGKLLALLSGLREDVTKGDTGGHVVSVGLGANLANQGSGSSLGELLDGVGVELLARVDSLALIEVLVENDGGGLDALSLGDGGVVDTTEEVAVAERLGNGCVGLVGGLVVSGNVGNEDDVVGGLEVLKGILGQDGDGGQGLLNHVGRDAGEGQKLALWIRFSADSARGGNLRSGLALASVGSDVLKATEDLEGRVTLNTVVLAEVSLLSAVNLGELDVLLLQGGSSLLVLGGEGLAVAAPGSEDWRRAKSAHGSIASSFFEL